MLQRVTVRRGDGKTGASRGSSRGICAIIAPCEKGAVDTPISAAKSGIALATFGDGALSHGDAYIRSVALKPTVLVRASASTAGSYGTVTTTGAPASSPSVITTSGTAKPLLDANVIVTFLSTGVVGTAGIRYTTSLDGGVTTSAEMALGTATQIVIPYSGVTILLAAGNVAAGETVAFKATGPRLTTSDISSALEALRLSRLGWEWLHIGGHDATAATVTLLDGWLESIESMGRFRGFSANARMMNDGESPSDYQAAMTTAFANAASIRGCVGVDGGDNVGLLPLRTFNRKDPTALALTARLMKISYGTDASYVNDGPVRGFELYDELGNPKNYDEALYNGLTNQRLVSLQSRENRTGTFIADPVTIAPVGSDYVYAQHVRTMNAALEIAHFVLTGELSRGIRKDQSREGPNGEIYAAEDDLLELEALVAQAQSELRPEVSDLRFTLSREDDVGANGPVFVNGTQEVSSKVYVKGYGIDAVFTRNISIRVPGT